jgi:CO/xanthine dehydrogenase Mo-binding subunit
MVRSGIGDAPKRREDLRFLTGQGRYLDDLAFDGLTHAVVLRSPNAHAYIQSIDTGAAKTMPGVLAMLTAADALADGLKRLLRMSRRLRKLERPLPSSQTGLLERPRDLFWGPASFCAIRVGVRGPGDDRKGAPTRNRRSY